jgi:tetratricopeptide (TPR) repeat protein
MNALVGGHVGLCLAAMAAATAAPRAAASTTQPVTRRPTTRPATNSDPTDLKANLRRLRTESRTPPEGATSAELQRMIRELKSISVSPRRRGRAPMAVLSIPGSTSRPAATTRPAEWTGTGPWTAAARDASTGRMLPREVMEQLEALPAASLSRPVELGDELYRSGYFGAAFALYERALKGASDEDTRGWSLYQMANCRRHTDPAAAEQLYQRVLGECPKTLWAQAAAIEQKLIQWNRVNRPMEMLKTIEPIGRERQSLATTRPATTRPATTQPAATQPAATQPAATQPAATQPAAAGMRRRQAGP